MMRPSVIVVSMSMLAACGGLAYLHASREQSVEKAMAASDRSAESATGKAAGAAESSQAGTARRDGAVANSNAAQVLPNSGETVAENSAASETVAQWIKETDSTDATKRAAAIAALADAPTAQALPVLKRVLATGEPNVDRHVALRSMYSLALRDGDTNGQIRDVMRHAIYHGDDDAVTQTAQSLLDDIEAEFSQRESQAQ